MLLLRLMRIGNAKGTVHAETSDLASKCGGQCSEAD